ncbi:hypothetical protein KY331_02530 [Candidatus Woesearchaeota archaeon]|nr:hypothetical protein [Candidatus Woesearchaeota archaeon]
MECKQEKIAKECTCTYPDCPRKGKCCECVKHHREKRELPACFFPSDVEKNYDRSADLFCQLNMK